MKRVNTNGLNRFITIIWEGSVTILQRIFTLELVNTSSKLFLVTNDSLGSWQREMEENEMQELIEWLTMGFRFGSEVNETLRGLTSWNKRRGLRSQKSRYLCNYK